MSSEETAVGEDDQAHLMAEFKECFLQGMPEQLSQQSPKRINLCHG
jgi:hypothetical protein